MAISKVIVEDSCTACGICEQTCPEVFEMKDIATVKAGADLNANEAKVNEAAEGCPVSCIKVE